MDDNTITIAREGTSFTGRWELGGKSRTTSESTFDALQQALIEELQALGQSRGVAFEVTLDDRCNDEQTRLLVAADGEIAEAPPVPQRAVVPSPGARHAVETAPAEPQGDRLSAPAPGDGGKPPWWQETSGPDELDLGGPPAQERALPVLVDQLPVEPRPGAVTPPAPVPTPRDFSPLGAAGPEHQTPATPAPVPEPAAAPVRVRPTRADLVQARPAPPTAPAALGWRALARRATFGAVALSPGRAELARRDAIARVQRSLSGPKTIVVLNPKGGAHKTTATLMIAATFGVHRGGNVLAWDNNETMGTLGARGLSAHHDNTAVDLLRDIDRFNHVQSARFGDLDNYVRTQGEARFDILASDDDPAAPTVMTGDDFRTLHDSLSRFYRVMVIDTGNNPRASNWQAAVDEADQLAIVTTLRDDTATVAAGLTDRLYAHGFADKLERSVTVLAEPDPRIDTEIRTRLTHHFGGITRAVATVPYEPAFVGGGTLDLETLRPATREAWLTVCALISDGLNT